MRGWAFSLLLMSAAQALAQVPVEDRRPPSDETGAAQRRIEFTRQALDRAEAGLRDATAAHRDARKRYDDAKSGLDKAEKDLARAQSAGEQARKAYERESSDLAKRRTTGGG